jgi:hypothetical protein
MDVTDFHDRPALPAAIAMCDDFTVLPETLSGMTVAGAEAVVVRNGGPPGEAAVARFAAALLAGARETQHTLGSARRIG